MTDLSWWQGLILGIVQGLTEFLPISSSGHLVLAERFVGFKPQGLFFEVMVHVATLLSVFIAYRARIGELLRGLFRGQRSAWNYAALLILASVPAGLAGILLKEYFERTFHSLTSLGWQFLITAVVLWSTKWVGRVPKQPTVGPGRALAIGIAQAIAIVPAISRSGMTIATGLWLGLTPAVAAEFSFLMSIIVIAGSGFLEFRHIPPGTTLLSAGLVWAFLSALVFGVIAIRLLVALLRSSRFYLFAPYCAVVGVLCLVWFGLLGR
ncbi:MAG: undecaprenyl-diphosphate phosphatase [Gemmatimonadota bacterium]